MEIHSTKTYTDNCIDIRKKDKKPRGATVYGIPYSKELGVYIDEASPRLKEEIFLNMLFAGRIPDGRFFCADMSEDIE